MRLHSYQGLDGEVVPEEYEEIGGHITDESNHLSLGMTNMPNSMTVVFRYEIFLKIFQQESMEWYLTIINYSYEQPLWKSY